MSIYTQTARFDTGRALTETEMRHTAPSIFAVTAHESLPAAMMTVPMISGPSEMWFRKTPSKAGCVALAVTTSAGRAV